MVISGAHSLPVPPARAWELLQDPAVLARCMPGCEALEPSGPDEYRMKMKMALSAISGLFDGKVRIAEKNPPASYRLLVEGTGRIGFMNGQGLLTLSAAEPGTTVKFEGDVYVGGTIAAVGQRLLDTTARMMIKRFFDKLAAEA
ncbi:MAG: SRPBCC family protein [Bryobacteraceae bacterium]